MTDSPRVLCSIESGIAHVRLNRPDKRNGLDLPMFEQLIATGAQLRSDRSVRAVVLSGEGKAFCAGLDWGSFLSMGSAGSARLLERQGETNIAQRVAWIWTEIEVPVVCAIRGAAFGGGLQIALACDMRIVAPDAQFSVMEIRYGLIPDMTITQTLLRLVRPDIARELMFTGRVVDADEAIQIGLATKRADDPIEEAMTIAKAIAQQSPHAIRAAKRLCDVAPRLDRPHAFELETTLQLTLLGTPNQMEAVSATMGKRAPRFSDPD